jgi:hypothetical protein
MPASLRLAQSPRPTYRNYAIKSAYLEPVLNHHDITFGLPASGSPNFEDMVKTAKQASVLVLVY